MLLFDHCEECMHHRYWYTSGVKELPRDSLPRREGELSKDMYSASRCKAYAHKMYWPCYFKESNSISHQRRTSEKCLEVSLICIMRDNAMTLRSMHARRVLQQHALQCHDNSCDTQTCWQPYAYVAMQSTTNLFYIRLSINQSTLHPCSQPG